MRGAGQAAVRGHTRWKRVAVSGVPAEDRADAEEMTPKPRIHEDGRRNVRQKMVSCTFLILMCSWPGLVAQEKPKPQIPQPIFRAPEDTWKTGVKPEDIK